MALHSKYFCLFLVALCFGIKLTSAIFLDHYLFENRLSVQSSDASVLGRGGVAALIHHGPYRVLSSQILWLVLGQDLTTCERVQCLGPYRKEMALRISELSPEESTPLAMASISLGVRNGNPDAALALYRRLLWLYPEKWTYPFRMAYHYLYDRPDPLRAAELLERAASLGAPSWTADLAQEQRGKALLLKSLDKNESELLDRIEN